MKTNLDKPEDLMRALRYTFIQQREIQGLTQTAVAGLMQITQSALSELETGGVKNPSLDTIFRWAQALNVDLALVVTCVTRTTFTLSKKIES